MTDVSRLPEWTDALAPLAGWPETLRALYSLDVGTLRDLGISPREIDSLVYGDNGDRIRGYDPDWWRHARR